MSDPGRRPLAKAAFIDRDGVINEERGFVHKVADFEFLTGSVDALRGLQDAGYLLVVITNQSGIARGLYTEADYLNLTRHMGQRLSAAGVTLAAVEFCPHLPDATIASYRLDCDCRKPRPGMLQRAAAALGIDMAFSVLIGDRASDLMAGRAAGVGRCFLVRSGKALKPDDLELADAVYDSLDACVRGLLNDDE